ncbi:MAG: hypothetical protein M5U12_10135 [Verrucomicrobia bacterium]|nr:hypothetical protein [Verrucomicrobiota bacterium]
MKARGTVGLSFLLAGWLREPWLRLEYAKELREILPYWLVSLGTSLVWLLGWPNALEGLALAAWGVGEIATVAMGAAVLGHEFSHRTMSLVLVQPLTRGSCGVGRWRCWARRWRSSWWSDGGQLPRWLGRCCAVRRRSVCFRCQ